MAKPAPTAIARAGRLTASITRAADPITACNLCGKPSERLTAHREHDQHDKPLPGVEALLFVGSDHPACMKALEDHPRLYDQERGLPGTFPRLCGPCVHRRGLACTHPVQASLGGAGLMVRFSGLRGHACSRGHGCRSLVGDAVDCAGQRYPGDVVDVGARRQEAR